MAEEESIEESGGEELGDEEGSEDQGEKKKDESLWKQAFKETMKETKDHIKSIFKKDKEPKVGKPKEKTKFSDKVKKLEKKVHFKKQINKIYQTEKKLYVEYEDPVVVSSIKKKALKIKHNIPTEIVNKKARISNLKKQLIKDIKGKPVSYSLPRAIEIAVLAGKKDETKWMLRELFGYFTFIGDKESVTIDKKAIPDYRKIDAYLEMRLNVSEPNPISDELLIPFFCLRSVIWLEDELEKFSEDEVKKIKIASFLPEELSFMKKYLSKQPIFLRMPVSDLKRILTEVKFRVDSFLVSL
jgi:hypothetical protein